MAFMKVGELARRTGLTVRTLHHYDELGLLEPAERTAAGHRLYGLEEVRRLQQIASLRQLGLPLGEIRACLEGAGYSLADVLELQIQRLQEEIDAQHRLVQQLRTLHDRVRQGQDLELEDVTRTIEGTVALERYYTPDQLERMARRREEVGTDRMRRAQEEWAELFDAFGEAMDAGLDVAAGEVQALARRSAALIEEFTGGDAGIRASLGRMYAQEGGEEVMARQGMKVKPGVWDYMTQAAKALASTDPAVEEPPRD